MSNCFRLDHLGALTISGPDAVAFAQAQFTNDIASMDPEQWYPGAWCDPRGRTLAVMLAGRREGCVELILPAPQVQAISNRLKMFAIGRDIEFTVGQNVCGCRDTAQTAAPLSYDSHRAIRLDQKACAHDQQECERWQREDLDARFPWLSADSAGRHLPQSLGLEALGGLSYSKGCFPGQEVIARVHYRGKVGYRVAQVDFAAGSLPPPGSVLRLEDGARAGEMLWGVSDEESTRGLAVVSTGIENGTRVFAANHNDGVSGRVSL